MIHRHLTDAIFPFFIIQKTIIVIAGHYLVPLQLQPWIKANVLIAITSGSCSIGDAIVHRVGVLRPMTGLKIEAKRVIATTMA